MSIFMIPRTTPRRIVCVRCLASERWWNERQEAKWKAGHLAACTKDPAVIAARLGAS